MVLEMWNTRSKGRLPLAQMKLGSLDVEQNVSALQLHGPKRDRNISSALAPKKIIQLLLLSVPMGHPYHLPSSSKVLHTKSVGEIITLSKLHEFFSRIFATIWTNLLISIGYQKKGWTCGEIRAEWIKIFDTETKDKVKEGEYWLLLVDGHNSHYTITFLLYACEHLIIIFCYIPHGTHIFQGLDVVIFSPLKKYIGEEWDNWLREYAAAMDKNSFSCYLWPSPCLRSYSGEYQIHLQEDWSLAI